MSKYEITPEEMAKLPTIPSASETGAQKGRPTFDETYNEIKKRGRPKKTEVVKPEVVSKDGDIDSWGETEVDINDNTIKAASLVSTPSSDPVHKYLSTKSRVSFETDAGTYTVPIVKLHRCSTGLLIMMSTAGNDSTFTPRLGAKLTIVHGEDRIPCYFPGLSFDIPELKLLVSAFILAE